MCENSLKFKEADFSSLLEFLLSFISFIFFSVSNLIVWLLEKNVKKVKENIIFFIIFLSLKFELKLLINIYIIKLSIKMYSIKLLIDIYLTKLFIILVKKFVDKVNNKE